MRLSRRFASLRILVTVALVGSCLRPAAAQMLGPEFQVNSYTTDWQFLPAVAADVDGSFFVTWSSRPQDGSGWGIFAQRFDAAGEPAGAEFRVNTYTMGYQRYSQAAAVGSGIFVVVWESQLQDGSGYAVIGRMSAPGGPAPSEFRVNTYTSLDQKSPAVAATGPGNFVVAWTSEFQDGSSYGVFAQRLMSPGSPMGGEFRVNTYTTGSQRDPAVAADGAGNFVVVWKSGDPPNTPNELFGQRFSSAGSKVGSEFQIDSSTNRSPRQPAVAADDAGNFVVVWTSDALDGSGRDVAAQWFDSGGIALGSELLVNSYTTGHQARPRVAAESSGNFVVVWDSWLQDGASYGVIGQRFDSTGVRVGGEFQVNSYTTSNQDSPAVAADGTGNFVVVWESWDQDGFDGGVFGQRLAALIHGDGFESGDACAWSPGCP